MRTENLFLFIGKLFIDTGDDQSVALGTAEPPGSLPSVQPAVFQAESQRKR